MVTKKWGVKNWREKKNQKSWKKSGCEKEAASELLFGLGVNDLEEVASELLFGLGVNGSEFFLIVFKIFNRVVFPYDF